MDVKQTLTKTEKLWDKGERIYDNFASQFGFKYSNPRTNTLEMFALLEENKEKEVLLRWMMEEFLSNLSDEELVLKNGKLYSVSKKYTKISPK